MLPKGQPSIWPVTLAMSCKETILFAVQALGVFYFPQKGRETETWWAVLWVSVPCGSAGWPHFHLSGHAGCWPGPAAINKDPGRLGLPWFLSGIHSSFCSVHLVQGPFICATSIRRLWTSSCCSWVTGHVTPSQLTKIENWYLLLWPHRIYHRIPSVKKQESTFCFCQKAHLLDKE
jgi:hypothetical protein